MTSPVYDSTARLSSDPRLAAIMRPAKLAETTDVKDSGQTDTDTQSQPAGGSDFDIVLKSLLKPDQANNVSEEDLFAAIVQQRVTALKGKDAGDQFATLMTQQQDQLRKPDGYVSMEGSAV